MPKKINRSVFIAAVHKLYGDIQTITRQQVLKMCDTEKLEKPNWLFNEKQYRTHNRGVYSLTPSNALQMYSPHLRNESLVTAKREKTVSKAMPPVVPTVPVASAPIEVVNQADMALAAVNLNTPTSISLIPDLALGYVPFGHFFDVRTIVRSGKFYPTYITGLSGNGKTMMIEQVCASEKREMIRVNITIETDEDDLIGGFRLVDGRTVWQNGPVVVAMERGAVLLLDEIDLGSNKLMCLQPILEGKPIYLKKINKIVTPMPGFTVMATANTKGKGSDDGRFIGTNVLNEAFLERFSITLEQEYPSAKTEEKILSNVLNKSNVQDNDFVSKLVQWAEITRKSFFEDAVSEIISTRRLVHICEAFVIFNQDRKKAVQLCLNRFDADTKNSFMDLYKKMDETIDPQPQEVSTTSSVKANETIDVNALTGAVTKPPTGPTPLAHEPTSTAGGLDQEGRSSMVANIT